MLQFSVYDTRSFKTHFAKGIDRNVYFRTTILRVFMKLYRWTESIDIVLYVLTNIFNTSVLNFIDRFIACFKVSYAKYAF